MEISLKDIRYRKEKRKKELEEQLDKIKSALRLMGAIKIFVFGSYAQGLVRSSSDLDIICVMPPTKTGKEWKAKIYEEVDRFVDCDILAYTEEELEKTMPVSRFLRGALKTGKVVYERRP